jgi:PKD domain-containing protein/type IX secretion system substrate protein
MKKFFILSILIISFSNSIFSQAGICEESDPFCTGNIYTFPAGVGTGTAQSGPSYGCLGTQPNPAWYHMKIAVTGNINIFMSTVPSRDIDFICWGPFSDPYDPCASSLTGNMIVDCSYSLSASETCNIPNGQVGEYYILLITNFSNLACDITFQKTSGTGETDCTIVPPPVGNNGPLCIHDNLELYADLVNNATYSWSGPAGFLSTQQNPIVYDVGLENAGIYQLVITVNGSPSDPVETIANINSLPHPDFTFNDACFGETTFFLDESTVEPETSSITSWNWDFGDGQVGVGQDQDHIYGDIGDYNVTLTTYTGFMACVRSETKTVTVFSAASVDAGTDITIPNGWDTQLDGTVDGGTGDYDLLWEPEALLNDATVEDPTTLALSATEVFKLNVTDVSSGCKSKDSMTVIVTGGALAISVSANPTIICQDEIVNLNALPSGGSGNNNYTWTSNPPGFTASIKEPSDYPQITTTYTVSVFDGQNTVEASIQVVVKPKPIGDAGLDIPITVGTSTTLNGSSATGGSGNFEYLWSPLNSLINPTEIHPQTIIIEESTEFTFNINDANGCSSEPDNMFVLVGGDLLSVFPTSSAINNVICQGEDVELFSNAFGGGGSYTYLWTDGDGFTSTEETPIVSPWETTTYTLVVNDTYKTISSDIIIIVNHTPVVDLLPQNISYWRYDTIKACVRDSVLLDAGDPLNPPLMNYLWSTSATTKSISGSTNGSWIAFETYWTDVENPVTGCTGRDTLTIFFDFDECSIGIDENNNLSDLISIVPNPTSDITSLKIDNLDGKVGISLLTTQGRLLWYEEEILTSGQSFTKDISLNSLPKGVYLIEIVHEMGVYNSRIIKQ